MYYKYTYALKIEKKTHSIIDKNTSPNHVPKYSIYFLTRLDDNRLFLNSSRTRAYTTTKLLNSYESFKLIQTLLDYKYSTLFKRHL